MRQDDVSATAIDDQSSSFVEGNNPASAAIYSDSPVKSHNGWSVLLVEDHELVRAGMRRLLEDEDAIDRFVEAASGEQALELSGRYQFDLIFLDLSLPGISGFETALELLRRWPDTHIVVLTAVRQFTFTRKLLDLGVKGYLTKDCEPEQLANAIHEVMAGRIYLLPDVARQLALGVPDSVEELLGHLSHRETEIMVLTYRGLRNTQIAERLFISEKTVHTYRARALEKLNVKSTAELTRLLHKLDAWDDPTG